MSEQRYNLIKQKNPREIVLLKSRPCAWGRCTFCDYILDNSSNEEEIIEFNRHVLSQVTGELGVLEVINSASFFDFPETTCQDLQKLVKEKEIKTLWLESHWLYHQRLAILRKSFAAELKCKIGVETFDYHFREKILHKGIGNVAPETIAEYFDSVCLLIGIKGQTREMLDRDVEILLKNFSHGCLNIFMENSTNLKADPELIAWFIEEYGYLRKNPEIDFLEENTDFGVFA